MDLHEHLCELSRMRTHGSNWLPPKHLGDQRSDVWEIITIRNSGQPVVPDHNVDLLLSPPLNLRIQSHGEKERRQCRHSLYREH